MEPEGVLEFDFIDFFVGKKSEIFPYRSVCSRDATQSAIANLVCERSEPCSRMTAGADFGLSAIGMEQTKAAVRPLPTLQTSAYAPDDQFILRDGEVMLRFSPCLSDRFPQHVVIEI